MIEFLCGAGSDLPDKVNLGHVALKLFEYPRRKPSATKVKQPSKRRSSDIIIRRYDIRFSNTSRIALSELKRQLRVTYY